MKSRNAVGIGVLIAAAGGLASACGGVSPPAKQVAPATVQPSAVASVVEPPAAPTWPPLQTGSLQPVDRAPLTGELLGYVKAAETETFRVSLPASDLCQPAQSATDWVHLQQEWSVGAVTRGEHCELWLRRRTLASRPAEPLQVEVLSLGPSDYYRGAAGQRTVVTAALPAKLVSNSKLTTDFYAAMLAATPRGPLHGVLSSTQSPSATAERGASESGVYGTTGSELSDLVGVLSGYDSIEASLHADTKLAAAASLKRANVPLSQLKAPTLAPPPWAKMLSQLSAESRAQLLEKEPLARVTPADFYWVRASNFESLEALGREADAWLSPALRLFELGSRDYDLVHRYRAQLGLSATAWTELLGPKLIRDIAIVGSDPFLRQGADVSLLVRPKDPRALLNALNAKAALDADGINSDVTLSEVEYRGVSVLDRRAKSADGLRQLTVHLSDVPGVGALTVLSNSEAALHRILDVVLDNQAALAGEPDFEYMLARDSKIEAKVLAFAGERFIEHAVAPTSRILDARRQQARAELTRVSYAALVFGWLEGREPKDVKELLASPWLTKKHLQHWNGEAIQFEIGQAPHSAFGTPAFLTPLVDLTPPKLVTADERDAYTRFAVEYAEQWQRVVDPIALRVGLNPAAQISALHVRILPLLLSSQEYREILGFAGDVRVQAPAAVPGVQFALGIAPNSRLRQEVNGEGEQFLGKKFGLDWLGAWVAVGLADDAEWIAALRNSHLAPELPREARTNDAFEELATNPPVYLALDIKHRAGAALALTLLRKAASEATGDSLTWGEQGKINGVSVIRVKMDEYQLFYALTEHRLYVAGQASLIKRLIEGDASFKPAVVSTESIGGQLVAGLHTDAVSPLRTAVSWLLEKKLREETLASLPAAAALLQGTHGHDTLKLRALAQAYLGYLPVSADNQALQLTQAGIADPARGSVFAPVYPALPIAESAVGKVLAGLRKLGVELALDQEPGADGLRSLRSQITFERDPARSKIAP